MGQALEKAAGIKLKSILSKLTSSPLKGLMLGIGVTAVIQSSAATTVMVVGFVNSGLMQLQQAVGVIMGANIGTTITAWILSLSGIEGGSVLIQLLKPTSFTPILALIGIALHMFSKRERKRDIGTVLLGFAVLMFGMDTMSTAVKPLANVPEFANLFSAFSNPFLGILVGVVIAAIVQSSSASVGILQALSSTGGVTFGSALPIIMGQKVGACVTTLISSIGTNKNARRAALVHLYFNIIGTVICSAVFYGLNAIFKFEFLGGTIDRLGIAFTHTLLNLIYTAIIMPFSRQLVMLTAITVPSDSDDQPIALLDERLIATPSIAVEHCRNITCDMANLVRDTIKLAISLLYDYSDKNFKLVKQMEDQSDKYEDSLNNFLVQLNVKQLSEESGQEVYELLHNITDFERISDHALNIAESAREISQKQLVFSKEAARDLEMITNAVKEIVDLAVDGFINESVETAARVEPLEEVIDVLNASAKSAHVKRLQEGECTIDLGFVFNDLMTNIERVSDHCSNIAVCQIELQNGNFDLHAYLSELKAGNDETFGRIYKEYRQKYSLPK